MSMHNCLLFLQHLCIEVTTLLGSHFPTIHTWIQGQQQVAELPRCGSHD